MAKIRVGFSSDFNVKGNNVGFGTTNPTARLNVVDTLKGDFNISGVTTLTSYGGFVAQNQRITQDHTVGYSTVGVGTVQQYYETETGYTDLGGVHHGDDQYFNTLSEDLVIDDGQILNITNTEMVGVTTTGEYDPHTHASHVCAGSLEEVSVTSHFSVPNGGINERPEIAIEGTVRFNTDLNTLEFFNGVEWRQFTYNQGQSGRGVIGGGATPADNNKSDRIESIQIQSLGRATDFGNLTQARRYTTSCSSSIRGVWAGGLYPTNTDIIDYVTIASGGNALDFGNIVTSDGTTSNVKSAASSCSSSTRGIFAGGYRPAVSNGINYIEIATTGNALVFAELIQPGYYGSGCSSSVRGVFQGHTNNNSAANYEMITIASKGNAVDFGEPNFKRTTNSMASNSVRGINAGGYNALSPWFNFIVNSIEYITIASNGSAEYFGDLTGIRTNSFNGCSTNTRGVFCGGAIPASLLETCDYVTIMTQGNAEDFGDLSGKRRALGQCSDSHGGLGGF